MLAFSVTWFQQLLSGGGYLLLFGLLLACGLGLPLPEDIPLIVAGALVRAGKWNIWIAAPVAWVGIIGGDLLLYHIGKRYGLSVTRIPFVGKHVTTARIEWAERMFDKYGIWVVAIGRLFAGVRGAMVIAAGVTRYNLLKFFIADGLAAIISGGLFVLLGYWLWDKLPKLVEDIKAVERTALIVLLLLVLGIVVWFVVQRKLRKIDQEAVSHPPDAPVPDEVRSPEPVTFDGRSDGNKSAQSKAD